MACVSGGGSYCFSYLTPRRSLIASCMYPEWRAAIVPSSFNEVSPNLPQNNIQWLEVETLQIQTENKVYNFNSGSIYQRAMVDSPSLMIFKSRLDVSCKML